MKTLSIGSHSLSYLDYQHILEGSVKLALNEDATAKIRASRTFLEDKSARSERPIYGVNTGFGSLCNIEISEEDLGLLQTNLVRSHACGMGDYVGHEVIRLMICLLYTSPSPRD